MKCSPALLLTFLLAAHLMTGVVAHGKGEARAQLPGQPVKVTGVVQYSVVLQ